MKKICLCLFCFLLAFSGFCAERIVVLTPAGCEILFAVGAENKVQARTDFCNYPEKALDLPSVGGFDGKTLSIEKIISFQPDLVYGAKGMHDFLQESCSQFGIELYLSSASSVQDVMDEILLIGKKTGCEEKSLEVVSGMKKGFEKIRKETARIPEKKRKSVYWEVWNSPYMSAGGSSFINEIITISGGKNIFAGIRDQDYPVVSEESILASNPDVIILPYGDINECSARTGWNYTAAVKKGNVFNVNDDLFSRPGPRILEAAETLQTLLK